MDWLRERTTATPDKIALIIDDNCLTYADVDGLANDIAGSLLSRGVVRGEIVAALMSNSKESVCLIHALTRVGAVMAPLNTRLTSGELEWQLRQLGGRHLIYDDSMSVKAEKLLRGAPGVAMIRVEELLFDQVPYAAQPDRESHLEEPQAVIFTSGTTGRPKGAKITYANQFYSAIASAFRLGSRPEDRWLSCLPLYHVGGLAVVLRSCLYGTAIVLHERFDVDRINHSFLSQDITLVSLVPTMLHRLLESHRNTQWPDSLRLILLGGAAASAELVSRSKNLQLPVATTYGLTEAASQVATLMPEGVERKPGSVGRPLMFTSIRIVGEQGQTKPAGELGEVAVSGRMVMAGYHNDAEATTKTLREGELYTGDIGYQDEDGDLWIVQRRSDVINSGGENVYPAEVESVLEGHPEVANVCVVGVDSAEWGQEVAAMIVRQTGAVVGEGDLYLYCRERLAGYKLPRKMKFVDELPYTASGKINRRTVSWLMNDDGQESAES